jgi:ABC-type Fe3+-siderophore transport system permease subunit
MNPLIDPALLSVATIGFICAVVALYFVIRVKKSFSGLPRLERPWALLGLGVASLLVAALAVLLSELSPSFEFARFIQVLAAVSAAFFILTAMVTMKQAWTIGEGD